MIVASPILMGSPKPGPVTDQESGGGCREEEAGEQMTGFGCSQRDEQGGGRRRRKWGRSREVVVDGDVNEEGGGE